MSQCNTEVKSENDLIVVILQLTECQVKTRVYHNTNHNPKTFSCYVFFLILYKITFSALTLSNVVEISAGESIHAFSTIAFFVVCVNPFCAVFTGSSV